MTTARKVPAWTAEGKNQKRVLRSTQGTLRGPGRNTEGKGRDSARRQKKCLDLRFFSEGGYRSGLGRLPNYLGTLTKQKPTIGGTSKEEGRLSEHLRQGWRAEKTMGRRNREKL